MSIENTQVDNNPHHICTWDDQSDCDSCKDHNLLFCKLDKKLQNAFLILFMPCLVVAFFGLTLMGILSGAWWHLIAYGAFTLMLFPVIEFGVLCRHCPFYADSGRMLNCLAGSGVPKTYRYNPRPMRKWEHLVMYCYYTFMIEFPVFGLGYGIYYLASNYSAYGKIALMGMIGMEAAFIFSIITFNYCLAIYVCRKCINYSCPWNKVEKPLVDEYLRRNPVMREAWEKEGYHLG
ncbi:MAG: hypothetical protein SWK76_10585 [Actinomycetota bacterium]|nr:hypothetical protein [Actinomycetota bacterium]